MQYVRKPGRQVMAAVSYCNVSVAHCIFTACSVLSTSAVASMNPLSAVQSEQV